MNNHSEKQTKRKQVFAWMLRILLHRTVKCEAITFEIASTDQDAMTIAKNLVVKHLGPDWYLTQCPGDPNEFDAIYKGKRKVRFADAWQWCHKIETDSQVVYAEPSLTFPVPGESDLPDDYSYIRRKSISSSSDKLGTEAYDWALKQCRVPEAWTFLKGKGVLPSKGVRIGHPDSGFQIHNEMDISRTR